MIYCEELIEVIYTKNKENKKLILITSMLQRREKPASSKPFRYDRIYTKTLKRFGKYNPKKQWL